jgi:hypothetical protein
MKKITFFYLFLFTYFQSNYAQVGISLPVSSIDSSAMLDIKSKSKGLLIPRMTQSERNVINRPANSLMVYQTDITPGYFYNAGSPVSPNWVAFGGGGTQSNYKIPITTLPINIDQPGSYILSATLEEMEGITISASNVNIDLNFSSLIGKAGNIKNGILIEPGVNNITIYNGNITNWGGSGISAPNTESLRCLHLTVTNNADDGIDGGNNSILENCIAKQNGLNGLSVCDGALILNCESAANGANGFVVKNYSRVLNCVAQNNSASGFYAGIGNLFSGNTSNINQQHGFNVNSRTTLEGNQSTSNIMDGFKLGMSNVLRKNSSLYNDGHGFNLEEKDELIENTATSNGLNGFHCDSKDNGIIENNTSTFNTGRGYSFSNSSNWLITKNKAVTNGNSNFDISPGNNVGVILYSIDISANGINITTHSNISL